MIIGINVILLLGFTVIFDFGQPESNIH